MLNLDILRRQQHVESDTLNGWKLKKIKIIDVEFHFVATI